jgi:DNA-binding PadR family transcriptional regulator
VTKRPKNERRAVGNLLALAVLSYLSQGPLHPYELSRTLREHGDARSIKFNHGSLYMVVQQLARAGFIVAQETTRAGQRPERTVYALTDAGRHEFRDWLRTLVEVPDHEYPHFVAALSLIAALPPNEVVDLLHKRLARLAEQRTETTNVIDSTHALGVHPLFLVEENYRLALLAAESAFVQDFIAQIENPHSGWQAQWAQFHQPPLSPASSAAPQDEALS